MLTRAALRTYDQAFKEDTLAKLRGALCALLLLLVPGVGQAQAPTSPELEEGLRLLRDMEDARALEALGRALERARTDAGLRARIYLTMGIAHGNLLKRQAATEAFVNALRADPSITLPPRTSPKIEALFRRARLEVEQPATGADESTPPPVAPAPPPARQPSFLRRHLPAIAVMGVAGGALVTGIVLGALSRSAADKAADIELTFDEASAHHDRAKRRALGANITFGIAGAAAVASGVLFYLSYRSERRGTTAALVPGPDGAALLLEGRF